jgi:hypothetical protein
MRPRIKRMIFDIFRLGAREREIEHLTDDFFEDAAEQYMEQVDDAIIDTLLADDVSNKEKRKAMSRYLGNLRNSELMDELLSKQDQFLVDEKEFVNGFNTLVAQYGDVDTLRQFEVYLTMVNDRMKADMPGLDAPPGGGVEEGKREGRKEEEEEDRKEDAGALPYPLTAEPTEGFTYLRFIEEQDQMDDYFASRGLPYNPDFDLRMTLENGQYVYLDRRSLKEEKDGSFMAQYISRDGRIDWVKIDPEAAQYTDIATYATRKKRAYDGYDDYILTIFPETSVLLPSGEERFAIINEEGADMINEEMRFMRNTDGRGQQWYYEVEGNGRWFAVEFQNGHRYYTAVRETKDKDYVGRWKYSALDNYGGLHPIEDEVAEAFFDHLDRSGVEQRLPDKYYDFGSEPLAPNVGKYGRKENIRRAKNRDEVWVKRREGRKQRDMAGRGRGPNPFKAKPKGANTWLGKLFNVRRGGALEYMGERPESERKMVDDYKKMVRAEKAAQKRADVRDAVNCNQARRDLGPLWFMKTKKLRAVGCGKKRKRE